jgi:hypothetical protein
MLWDGMVKLVRIPCVDGMKNKDPLLVLVKESNKIRLWACGDSGGKGWTLENAMK